MSSPSTVNVPPDDREVLTFWTASDFGEGRLGAAGTRS